MNFLQTFVGYFMIFIAVLWGRTGDSEINLFSKRWFITTALVIAGTYLLVFGN